MSKLFKTTDSPRRRVFKTRDSALAYYVNQLENLAKWLIMPFHRTQDYFFVDHDGEGWLIMLALVKSGIIRKTVKIVTA